MQLELGIRSTLVLGSDSRGCLTPSPYQQQVFDFVRSGTGSAIVNAVAGSGKTTTLIEAVKQLSVGTNAALLAFNKRIAEELKSRLPAYVPASTFHSAGYAAWRRRMGSVTLDVGKMTKLRKRLGVDYDLQRLVSIAKAVGLGALQPDTDEVWSSLADSYGIYFDEVPPSEWIPNARKLLSASVEVADNPKNSTVDFDDMLYMPLLRQAPFHRLQWLFVDEAQDLNPVQIALLKMMLEPGGRMLAVGDRNQSIYAFRGADEMAMDNIKASFGCQEMPLSISYRCPKAVVKLAQRVVAQIEESPTAIEGRVWDAPESSVTLGATDAVLCRQTAPLLALAYRLLSRRVACKVLGRDLGSNLIALANKFSASSVTTFTQQLEKYVSDKSETLSEASALALRDQANCLTVVLKGLGAEASVPRMLEDLKSMFSDKITGFLTLSTVHKAKGMEWDSVYILEPDLLNSVTQQEQNISYAAWTRSKRNLCFLRAA